MIGSAKFVYMHIIFKNYCYRRCPNLAKRSTRGSPDLRCATCGFYYANKSSLNAHVSYFTYHLCAYRIFKCFMCIRFRKRNVFLKFFQPITCWISFADPDPSDPYVFGSPES
jgi:hypothetical protein